MYLQIRKGKQITYNGVMKKYIHSIMTKYIHSITKWPSLNESGTAPVKLIGEEVYLRGGGILFADGHVALVTKCVDFIGYLIHLVKLLPDNDGYKYNQIVERLN